ncbi:uncharacterized protein G2W53_031445 [Senna tora]|uniref:Uncharacterized protein n=1 Tax=Senna tora TaxID=362788 RepID=A0A834WFJ8_9FABA|nr:uncharacterized protein G2W53_031445 [Senna tora]
MEHMETIRVPRWIQSNAITYGLSIMNLPGNWEG